MISIDEARAYVLAGLRPPLGVEVATGEARGCVACAPVLAREPSPRFDNSSMDGYALRAADTLSAPVRLRLVGRIHAGDQPSAVVGAGEAARIMTGAPLPRGADSVCRQEDTALDADDAHVVIERAVQLGESVRRVGEDVTMGQTLVRAGDALTPAHLGVLAGQGIGSVLVHPRPRVAVLSTGNELATSDSLSPGQIRDSNRPALLATIAAAGWVPIDLGTAGDSPEAIRAALSRGLEVGDAVISTGGVSVGDADFVKAVVAELCPDYARSMQVAVRPGKPFAFGRSPSGKPVFCLAGNPVSTLVGFELFVRPALRALAGFPDPVATPVGALTDVALERRPNRRTHLVHADVAVGSDGRLHVVGSSRQGSHLLSAVASANALVVLDDGGGAGVGAEVPVLVLGPVPARA
jgi:molybdopterin molybdotransferase